METEQLAAMTLCSLADLQQSRIEEFHKTHQLDAHTKEDFLKVVKWFLNGKISLLELVEKLIMIIGWQSATQFVEFLRKELGIAVTDEVHKYLESQKPSGSSSPPKFILYAVEMSLAKEKLPSPQPTTQKRSMPSTPTITPTAPKTTSKTKDDGQPPRKRAKKVEWSLQEDELLKSLISKYPKEKYSNKWSLIADHFPGKTEGQCYEHWHRVLDPSIKKGPWEPDEEAKLEDLVKRMNGKVKWAQVASQMGGRIDTACRYYYTQMIKSRESSWSAVEDEELMKTVKEVKDPNAVDWIVLSQNLRQRIGKSKLPIRSALDCKIRYLALNKENGKTETTNELKASTSNDNNANTPQDNNNNNPSNNNNSTEPGKPNLQVNLLNRESEIDYDTGTEE